MILRFYFLNKIMPFSKSLKKLFNALQIVLSKIKRKIENLSKYINGYLFDIFSAESQTYTPNLTVTPFELNQNKLK